MRRCLFDVPGPQHKQGLHRHPELQRRDTTAADFKPYH